jgi:anion-transporting  ArsA/GET3 family ATPase
MSTQTLGLSHLIHTKKVIVCCGAGGVGKTTTAAAISVQAARLGKRVLVLTIDPSKRLAEALGVAPHAPAPVKIPEARANEAGISESGGSLEAWMLDPKVVADQAVRRIIQDESKAQRFLNNRVYREATRMIAGMQEYTAMKALHRYITDPAYDFIVLDTPPSRHALDFLDAPSRVAEFLEGRIFKLFVPGEAGFFRRAASSMVHKVVAGVLGEDLARHLEEFFGLFSGIFRSLNQDLRQTREYLSSPQAAFLIVTSPLEAARVEAQYFLERARELELPVEAVLLNRSQIGGVDPVKRPEVFSNPALESAWKKLEGFSALEKLKADEDFKVLAEIRSGLRGREQALALPWVSPTAEGMKLLLTLGARLLNEQLLNEQLPPGSNA